MPSPGLDELKRCLATLESLSQDPGWARQAPESLRVALIAAAGRIAHPTRQDRVRRRRLLRQDAQRRQENVDRLLRAATDIRVARRAPVFAAPTRLTPEEAASLPPRELQRPRFCYVCKAPFARLHFFYDAMCPACGDFNYAKRFQTAPLEGRVALVTGARLKIGYQASLMLLRAGARVIATTRFPHDAARRYSREPDCNAWRDRLQVHGLDLRHSPSVEIFARYLSGSLERLDVLINNAAQTVRRPPAFYSHLLDREALPAESLPPGEAEILRSHRLCLAALDGPQASPSARAPDATGMAVWHAGRAGIGLRESAQLSQIKYAYEDAELGRELFPQGRRDPDLQQVDLRAHNSWRMTLAEVPTAEMLELQLINSVAPFILCARLKSLMSRAPGLDKHIVNVSAMEGVFSRHTKTDKHPHTNMAKAALNMLTLTSAPDYVKSGIHINAVDTGWVTDEDPAVHSRRKHEELDFQPPLDIVDGAARVCDPVFSGRLTGEHVWGKFLKDYKPAAW